MDLPKYVKALKELLELMKNHDLAEVELEEDGQKVRLRKSEPHVSAAPIAIQGSVPGSQPDGLPGVSADGTDEVEEDDDLHRVEAPLVGTFYRASSPEADPNAAKQPSVLQEISSEPPSRLSPLKALKPPTGRRRSVDEKVHFSKMEK